MDSPVDKEWASKYLLDPLFAPEPSQETGPGSHFVRPQEKKLQSLKSYPSPPSSASPTRSSFHQPNPYNSSHRQKAFADYADQGLNGRESPDNLQGREHSRPSSSQGEHSRPNSSTGERSRPSSSLGERYPGDMSHRPLEQIRKEAIVANRAPYLRKKHIPMVDLIDSLDSTTAGITHHHGGPYDATLLVRNTHPESSPVEAVRWTNDEALKATPKDKIRDSLDKHVPLQGTAVIPPGFRDLSGRLMEYEEGADLMREQDAPGGAYRRVDGLKYLPDDLKGKGEPSYSIEKALKEKKINDNAQGRPSDEDYGHEMETRSRFDSSRVRSGSGNRVDLSSRSAGMRASDLETGVHRRNTTGRKVGETLKKKFGSLRKSAD